MTELPTKQWLRALAQCADAMDASGDGTGHPEPWQGVLASAEKAALQFARATVDKIALSQDDPRHRTHIAVLGPTQSGKSSLCNTLLDTQAARVSPLAGFTVHAQGYGDAVSSIELGQIEHIMNPMARVSAQVLDAKQLDQYVLESVTPGPNALLDGAVILDTPDFDSISAQEYSHAVIKASALADLVILMVSKDKYGDKRVWDTLALLNALQKPMLICINKADDDDHSVIYTAFSKRWLEQFHTDLPTVLLIPFRRSADIDNQQLVLRPELRSQLQSELKQILAALNRDRLSDQLDTFIKHYEDAWLAPLLEHVQARDEWSKRVDQMITEADTMYAETYLNNPEKYETFNRALVELLGLIDIPGGAKIAYVRQLVTWPARRLLGIGRQMVQNTRTNSNQPRKTPPVGNQEALILDEILEKSIVAVQSYLLDRPENTFWTHIDRQVLTRQADLRGHYQQTSKQVRENFEPEIERTAQQLYKQLQKQPATLNLVRAARVTADAGGIALAVKSGGLTPADLIVAPAMLSITTLLTESALGMRLEILKKRLKARQRQHMRQSLFQPVLGDALRELANDPSNPLTASLDGALMNHLDAYRKRRHR